MLKIQDAIKKFYHRCIAMNVSYRTVETYRYIFKGFNAFLATRNIDCIESVTPDDIRAYLGLLRTKGYAPDTIKDRYVGIAALFNFLCADGLIVGNPVKAVKKPKVPKIKARTFTASELQRILGYYKTETFAGLRNKTILYLLYGTGIRKSELLGLTVFSLHLDMSSMTVIGKGEKEREVPLSPVLIKLLRIYLGRREEILINHSVETSMLIITKYGRPLTDSGLREVFRELKDKAGIAGPKVSPHTMRHSFAKNFLLNGGNLFSLQEVLGHEDVSTTRIYVDYNKLELGQQMRNFCPLDNSKWSYLG